MKKALSACVIVYAVTWIWARRQLKKYNDLAKEIENHRSRLTTLSDGFLTSSVVREARRVLES